MFKAITNISSAVKDLASIVGKEVEHQLSKASTASESTTSLLAEKTHSLKEQYEANLTSRKNGKAPSEVTPLD